MLGIPDEEAGERVGAVIRLGHSSSSSSYNTEISLAELRTALWEREVEVWKLPTLLRVLGVGERVDGMDGGVGKVAKGRLREGLFGRGDFGGDGRVLVWEGEGVGEGEGEGERAFDAWGAERARVVERGEG